VQRRERMVSGCGMLVLMATQSKPIDASSVSVTPIYCGLKLDRCYIRWQNAAGRQVRLDAREFFNAASRQAVEGSWGGTDGL
jgi:hypothetical protein